jgi:DNA-binding transcriptional ArsR family regulator
MNEGPYIAEIGALIGDPARACMLGSLVDGRARTATELALIAGIAPPTASSHLARLVEGRLLAVERQGRHRYYRLAGPQVAAALEALAVLAAGGPPRHRPPGPREAALRLARTCYDHLAGRLGVALTEAMLRDRLLAADGADYAVTAAGAARLAALAIDLEPLRRQRRCLARACLDWSERRPHLAGALGAALADRLFQLGWLDRLPESRGVRITGAGRDGLAATFALPPDALALPAAA